jgi:hypothetical protein
MGSCRKNTATDCVADACSRETGRRGSIFRYTDTIDDDDAIHAYIQIFQILTCNDTSKKLRRGKRSPILGMRLRKPLRICQLIEVKEARGESVRARGPNACCKSWYGVTVGFL